MEIGSVIELDEWEAYKNVNVDKKFWLPFMKKKCNYKTVFYQSGRNAIEALMKPIQYQYHIDKILLPDYVCETVLDAVIRADMDYELYNVNAQFELELQQIENYIKAGIKCIYVVQYFGKKFSNQIIDAIKRWKEAGIIVVEDITMSLFSDDEMGVGFGDYILGSIRKWLPIPDGAFVCAAKKELPESIRTSSVSKYTDYYRLVQTMKKMYIEGGFRDKKLKENYMTYYHKSIEELFSDYQLYPMSEFSMNYIKNYDMERVINTRKENYDYLYGKIKSLKHIHVKIKREYEFIPLGMVLECSDRDDLLEYLISKDIYCNVHWRLKSRGENPAIERLSNTLLTVPCDQRYGMTEMDYIADTVKEWDERHTK